MEILVEVPDATESIEIKSYKESGFGELLERRCISTTTLQSMTVSDEPCKWCAIESEIEPCCGTCENINGTKTNVCHDCDGQSRFYPMKHFCGYCGRDLRKDVER